MRIRSLIVPIVLAGVLVACGDDDSDSSATTAATATTAAPSTASPATTAMPGAGTTSMAVAADIVDTAVAAGDFTTLVTAVQAAGLEGTLRGDGPFTVFAPTDEAFAALPAGTIDQLLADPTGDLADILTYHVVEGEVMAADVAALDGKEVTTVEGGTFTVNVGTDGSVTLTDADGNEVAVTTTDIETSNGVIHVIDGVLLPG